jgi:Guanylate-binding protein, N-terminal domain
MYLPFMFIYTSQLLGRSSGFQVASTHKPCTKGIWMWSAPIKRMALDGTEYNLLLLDTEGIDAYDQTVSVLITCNFFLEEVCPWSLNS